MSDAGAAPAAEGGDLAPAEAPEPVIEAGTPEPTEERATSVNEPDDHEPVAASEDANDGVKAEAEADEAEEAEPAPTKHKVKWDGEEREVTTDELVRNYELRRASHSRFEEASQMRKQAEAANAQMREIAQALKDPRSIPDILVQLGHDPATVRAALDAYEAVPADQRRAQELERRERELRAYEQRIREAEEQKRMQADTARYRARLEEEARQSLSALGLGESEAAMNRWAVRRLKASERGEPITADQAAREVAEQMRKELALMLKSTPADRMREILGDEVFERLAPQPKATPRPGKRAEGNPKASPQQAQPRRQVRIAELEDLSSFFDS